MIEQPIINEDDDFTKHIKNLENKKKLEHIEPVFSTLYNVEIINEHLTENEIDTLKENIHKITNKKMYIYVNDDNVITKAILKLDAFDFKIIVHNKNGDVVGNYIFKKCKFKNLMKHLIKFNWGSSDILRYKLPFTYEEFKFVD